MGRKGNKEHIHIAEFNTEVTTLDIAYKDFFDEMQTFNAGEGYKNFNDFILEEAMEYRDAGEGATHIVWNVVYNENGIEQMREIVSFYTLATSAIPYEDRIRLDEDEEKKLGKGFDSQICGIPALEIKMFAVDEKYQDIFFEYQGEDLPISAWIMRNIVSYAKELISDEVGFKAIFLHSLPDAEKFYLENEFNRVQINMKPLYGVNSEYTAMYFALKTVHMNYDM